MKKLMALVLAIILIVSFAACTQKNAAGTASDQANSKNIVATDNTVAGENTDESSGGQVSAKALSDALSLLTDADHSKWPKDFIHPDMPEYKKGKLNGWNQWSKDDPNNIFILIHDTIEEDLEAYKAELLAAGFKETDQGRYRKGLYDVEFRFNGDTILQISSYKAAVLAWPKDLDFVPQIKKGNLSSIIKPSDDMPGYTQLYYINLTQADLDEWYKNLADNGFTVDNGAISKANVSFRGKTYTSLDIQCGENGTNEWMIDFSFSE